MKTVTLLLPLLLLALSAAAQAQSCSVTASPVAFGSYNPNTATPIDTTGTVTITCRALIAIGVSYTLSLTAGSGGSFTARSMAGPGTLPLLYQIYTDAARSQIWGDGTGGSIDIADGYPLQIALPVVRNYTMYARLPARQLPAAGVFNDSLMVTITY